VIRVPNVPADPVLFLETSIIFELVFNLPAKSFVEKLKRDLEKKPTRTYFPKSALEEYSLVLDTVRADIDRAIGDSLKKELEKWNIRTIDKSNCPQVLKLISRMELSFPGKSNARRAYLNDAIIWACDYLSNRVEEEGKVDIYCFLIDFVTQNRKIREKFEYSLSQAIKDLKGDIPPIEPNKELHLFLMKECLGNENFDAKHIATAMQMQFGEDVWTGIVSLDQVHFLTNKNLNELFIMTYHPGIACISLSNDAAQKGLNPIEWFRKYYNNPGSMKMKYFAHAVKSATSAIIIDESYLLPYIR